jgi:hypothetical protein
VRITYRTRKGTCVESAESLTRAAVHRVRCLETTVLSCGDSVRMCFICTAFSSGLILLPQRACVQWIEDHGSPRIAQSRNKFYHTLLDLRCFPSNFIIPSHDQATRLKLPPHGLSLALSYHTNPTFSVLSPAYLTRCRILPS